MTALPLGRLRRITITEVFPDWSVKDVFSNDPAKWMFGPVFAHLFRGARTGEQWLIRWHEPQPGRWMITEARRCGR